jgi:hypothetical protein
MGLVSAQVLRCHDMSRIGRRLPVDVQYSNFIRLVDDITRTVSARPLP